MDTKVLSWSDRSNRRKTIADAIAAGCSPDSVARLHGVSLETVRRACQEHDVPITISSRPVKNRSAGRAVAR